MASIRIASLFSVLSTDMLKFNSMILFRISNKIDPLYRKDDTEDDQDPPADFWEVLH